MTVLSFKIDNHAAIKLHYVDAKVRLVHICASPYASVCWRMRVCHMYSYNIHICTYIIAVLLYFSLAAFASLFLLFFFPASILVLVIWRWIRFLVII